MWPTRVVSRICLKFHTLPSYLRVGLKYRHSTPPIGIAGLDHFGSKTPIWSFVSVGKCLRLIEFGVKLQRYWENTSVMTALLICC